jgi:hypothetical protein
MAWIIQNIRAPMLSQTIQEALKGYTIMQVFTGMNFEAEINPD